MPMNIWKIASLGCTVAAGVLGVISGMVDQKVMAAEVAEQIAKTLGKK